MFWVEGTAKPGIGRTPEDVVVEAILDITRRPLLSGLFGRYESLSSPAALVLSMSSSKPES